jgi:hypothetical protein
VLEGMLSGFNWSENRQAGHARIDDYSNVALSDSLFVLDDSKPSHVIIQGLRTLDWYRQNPAIAKLSAEVANKARPNSLFVLGRNIYQAACGSSSGAVDYLGAFMSKTSGVTETKLKALFDGILFEIFFDSQAKLRAQPKNRCIEGVFELQRHEELSESFSFIAECLLAHADRFHAIPGKDRQITVDIVTTKFGATKFVVEEVRFDGSDILWIDDDDFDPSTSTPVLRELSIEDFEKRLSDEMVVPARLLTATYMFDKNKRSKLLFPEAGTTRKR